MVFESLLGIKAAEKHPLQAYILGLLYAVVAILLALWIFGDQASLVLVFLTVLASVPFIHNALKREEIKDKKIKKEGILMREHWKIIRTFMFLFLGFVTTMVLSFIFLPESIVNSLFSSQIATINAINGNLLLDMTTLATAQEFLAIILLNNVKVLFFCVAFSLFYGAGAIFILTWNATVISAAIGSFIRNHIATYATSIGLMNVGVYFSAFSLGILRYMTHGIFEIFAYFIGGLAGGILSFAIINRDFKGPVFKRIMKDFSYLILIALGILIFAALVEVFITPLLMYY